MRSRLALVALLALTVSACDSAGEVEPLFGTLAVSLTRPAGGSPAILLESDLALPCAPDMVVESRTQPDRLTINVLGTEPTNPPCATQGPSTATVPFSSTSTGAYAIEIVYGGFSDEYAYRTRNGGELDSVRTTITHLGPR